VVNPPVCVGNPCEEIYPGECVAYTGPAIECLGITNGMSLNEIVQILASQLCTEGCCTNPVEWLLQYALDVYNIQLLKGEAPSILLIIEELLKRGIAMSNCNTCCPDYGTYLFGNKDVVGTIVTSLPAEFQSGNPNNAYNFATCLDLLSVANPNIHSRFDGTLSEVENGTEWGSISGNTILCIINRLFNNSTFDSSTLYDIIDLLLTEGLAVRCKSTNLMIISFTPLIPN
jgi:hypothetical protein